LPPSSTVSLVWLSLPSLLITSPLSSRCSLRRTRLMMVLSLSI
jgi:hypothetical protein